MINSLKNEKLNFPGVNGERLFFLFPAFVCLLLSWVIISGIPEAKFIFMLVALFGLFFYFLVKTRQAFPFVLLITIIPFNVGDLFNIPDFMLYEVIIPVYSIAWFIRASLEGKIGETLSIRKESLNLPIFLFLAVLIINYLRYPLLPAHLLGTGEETQGLRIYYQFLLCFVVYFFTIKTFLRDNDPGNIIKFLFVVSAIMALLGIFMSFFSFSIPGLTGLTWNPEVFYFSGFGIKYLRIGFLDFFSSLGIILIFCDTVGRKVRAIHLLTGILFVITLILSGGRAALGSTVIVFFFWCLFRKRYLTFSVLSLFLLFIWLNLSLLTPYLPEQLQRLSAIENMAVAEPYRYVAFGYYIKSFLQHPIWGSGLGQIYDTGLIGTTGEFVSSQLRFGGHGTYLSLMHTMGLSGLVPFLWMLIGAFSLGVKLYTRITEKYKPILIFIILYLTSFSIQSITGGKGDNIFFYFILGLLEALLITSKRQAETIISNNV